MIYDPTRTPRRSRKRKRRAMPDEVSAVQFNAIFKKESFRRLRAIANRALVRKQIKHDASNYDR
jgi:hypothetical protein